MSVELMAQVWRTKLPAGEKLCLLALADWANDDGSNIYPKQETVAAKCSCSERAVRDNLHRLEGRGVLVEVRTPGGNSRRSREYCIDVSKVVLLQGQPAEAAVRQPLPPQPAAVAGRIEEHPPVEPPKAVASPQRGATSGRPHDHLWETFDEMLGQVTNDSERGRRNRALKAIRQSLVAAGVEDNQLQAVALRQRITYAKEAWGTRGITVTEMAIANNWRTLGAVAEQEPDPSNLSAAAIYELTREVT